MIQKLEKTRTILVVSYLLNGKIVNQPYVNVDLDKPIVLPRGAIWKHAGFKTLTQRHETLTDE